MAKKKEVVLRLRKRDLKALDRVLQLAGMRVEQMVEEATDAVPVNQREHLLRRADKQIKAVDRVDEILGLINEQFFEEESESEPETADESE